MQLQILFSNDTAWMNLVDTRTNTSLPVILAKQKAIPLYFILNDGDVLGGPSVKQWYFSSLTELDRLKDSYFGNLLDYIRSGRTFTYKKEECSGSFLTTWLYDQAVQFMKANTRADRIDEIAITGTPAWTDEDLNAVKKSLDFCQTTKVVPFSTFFAGCDFVAIPVGRAYQVGKFEADNQWKMIYQSPLFDFDVRIRSMGSRIVEKFSTYLSEAEEQQEQLAAESFLRANNVLGVLAERNTFDKPYRGMSKRGLREVRVLFEPNEAMTPDDQRHLNAVALNSEDRLHAYAANRARVEFVGDGYCFTDFQNCFREKMTSYNTFFTTTDSFLQRIFGAEWGDVRQTVRSAAVNASTNSVMPVGVNTADLISVNSLDLTKLRTGDIVKLHGADPGKPDSHKELRYRGSLQFEILQNNRWGAPGLIIQAKEMTWAKGSQIRFQVETQVAKSRTLIEILVPAHAAEITFVPPSVLETSCSSAFVLENSGATKNSPLNSLNLSDLNVGDVVSLHGVDPAGQKAPTRKELRYLGNSRFETLENTRGWSRPGETLLAQESTWNLGMNIRFLHEASGKTASTRSIDSIMVH